MQQFQEENSIRNGESGVALVATLWVVILLAIVATAVISMFRSDARILEAQTAQYQATEQARAAINLAIVGLSDPHGNWPTDGTPEQLQLGDAMVEVRVSRESGKVDLNTSNPDLLSGLLATSGAGPGLADEFARAILDRRMAADAMGRRHPIESLGELMQLPKMTSEIYREISPNLTVYSKLSSVDVKFASPEVILALPGNTQADVEAAELSRREGSDQDAESDLSRIIGQSFSITAIVRIRDGTVARRSNIIMLTGNPKDPVWVLAGE